MATGSERARQAAGNLDRKEAVSGLAHETLAGTLGPTGAQKVPATVVMQQHVKGTTGQGLAPAPAGPAAHVSTTTVSPTATTAARPEPQPMKHTSAHSGTGLGTAFATPTTSSSNSSGTNNINSAGAGDEGVSKGVPQAGSLVGASTAQGPLVATTVEEGAQAQQVLQLMDNYDFRIYGQGLMAGADAVPLTSRNHQVLYKPNPEETREAPLPPSLTQQQQQDSARPGGATAGASPAAAAAAAPGRVVIDHTPSGTPAIPMQPLPAISGSSSSSSTAPSKLQGVVEAAASALPSAGKSASTAVAGTPAGVPVSSPIGSTTKAEQLKRELQHQAPVATARMVPVDSSSGSSTRVVGTSPVTVGSSVGILQGGLVQRHAKQGGSTGYSQPFSSTEGSLQYSSSSSSGGGGSEVGFIGRMKRRVTGFWEDTKQRVVADLNWLLNELIYAVWVVLQWVGWLLMYPLKAVFGPWYRYNRYLKAASASKLSQPYDIATLQEALGALPSWLAGIGGSTEELGWLNKLLAQVWPTLDPIVCELIRSSIEPLLDDMKPAVIAKMGFQRLTLGELPIALGGMRLVGTHDDQHIAGDATTEQAANAYQKAQAAARQDDRIEIEVDFQWVGEPNISFFVELAVAGPYTRLVTKVSNLSAQGTLRLGLTRLVPQLPGFGAVLISFARVPQIKFSLDLGPVLGGKLAAKPVVGFLDPFLRDTLASMLVWPNRFVIPLLPRDVTGNLDSLALHSVGVLEVDVLSAQQLPKKGGILSTVDPQVEMWTQPQHHVHSAVKKNRRNPKWKDQVLEVLVQEPDSQVLRVVMHDIDILNPKELFQLNVFKGATSALRSANPIGWASLPLRDICRTPFERQEVELRLAGSQWAYELGVVGEDEAGTLNLAVTYKPFVDLPADSTEPINCRGALFVTVRQCQELHDGDWGKGEGSDPYVFLKIAGQKSQTAVMPNTRSPIYNSHHEFFNLQLPDVLTIQVYDRDFLKPDDLIGHLELPVKTIITWTQGGVRGMRDGWWRLKRKKSETWETASGGRIEMKIQFRPYNT